MNTMGTKHARRHGVAESSLGQLLVVAEGESVIGLYFPQHRYPPPVSQIGPRVDVGEDGVIDRAADQLGEYLTGRRRHFELSVNAHGDEFCEQVWTMLSAIPYGETTTYGSLAERLGNRHLAQRVGWAVGHNPISIVIPCHRVVGSDGSLTGFAGGLWRKRALLDLEEPESARTSRLF